MAKKSVKLTSAESLALHGANQARNLAIAEAQRLANEALARFNEAVVEVLSYHGEGVDPKAQLVNDPKTGRPVSIDWEVPDPPKAE